MAAFDTMPESSMDIDAQLGLNGTPGTVSKLLVGPVLQDAIRSMGTAPLPEVQHMHDGWKACMSSVTCIYLPVLSG